LRFHRATLPLTGCGKRDDATENLSRFAVLWNTREFSGAGLVSEEPGDNVLLALRGLIPMLLSAKITHVLFLILACALPALAGPLAPCVKAVSSKNGNFLVITDVQMAPEQGNTAKVHQVSLQVFPKENFINSKDRVTAPAAYWTTGSWMQWSAVLDSHKYQPSPTCPVPLITDDGEFLIVLNLYAYDSALQIYRRRDHESVNIKDITLREIWPADKLADVGTVNDETPQWFAGGTFEFSPDCRLLIHKTRWGNTVRINLQDGSVSRN
jgi:hypothetical protein